MVQREGLRVNGIDHLNITVSELERSTRFYCDILGMEEAFREPPWGVFLKCGRDVMALEKARGSVQTSGIHFGFRVKSGEEVDRWWKWLKEKGVTLVDERRDESGRGIYFHDPDGYLVEIYYEKE